MQKHGASGISTITLFLIGGALAGAAVGLMFAPKNGSATRKELKQYAAKVTKDVSAAAQRAKGSLEAAFEKGRALLESTAA